MTNDKHRGWGTTTAELIIECTLLIAKMFLSINVATIDDNYKPFKQMQYCCGCERRAGRKQKSLWSVIKLAALFAILAQLITSAAAATASCNEDVDCDSIEFSLCVDGGCQCPANYLLVNNTKCAHFKCKHDVDCQSWDKHRICSKHASRGCICPHGMYEDSITRSCRRNTSIAWMLVVLLLPGLIVIIFCIRCFRLARTDINQVQHKPKPSATMVKNLHRSPDINIA